jgi:hypothetical protein
MTILAGDIKLLKSDTMSDVPEGGGAITGQLVVSGVSNNIFDDISSIDRVYGAVHMRKVFPAVQTQNTDRYFGSHVIISKLPGDSKIGVNLFNTSDYFDRRPTAKNRVENYRARGPRYSGYLWSTQYLGSRAITIFQGETAAIPGIGDVLELVSATASQAIKITKLVSSIQTFTDGIGPYQRRILEIIISDALTADFVGSQMTRVDPETTTPALIYKTVIANAARYYSARPLAQSAALGALSLKVDTIYSQVVPSSQAELALIDVTAASNTLLVIDASTNTTTVALGGVYSQVFARYLGSPVLPGSVSIDMLGFGFTLVDRSGTLTRTSDNKAYGVIIYATGEARFNFPVALGGGAMNATFRPAAAPIRLADTAAVAVTSANRGYVWTINLNPPPQPGSLSVSYRALNTWYELRDDGTGGLIAEELGIGTGSVNYSTGSVVLTTAALPDADSEIIYAWGKAADFFNRSAIPLDKIKITHQLEEPGFVVNSLVITWNDGGVLKTATCSSAGVISGAATGLVNLGTNVVSFSPTTLPMGGTTYNYNYTAYVNPPPAAVAPVDTVVTVEAIGANPNGNLLTFDLGRNNILPGTLKLHWDITWDSPYPDAKFDSLFARDNGSGTLEITPRSSTIDYTLGLITFDPTEARLQKTPVYADDGIHFTVTR